mmetsp:Transcript_96118/g.222827  ORF Transcript_96118/g.222827 Transcript_96118/m.222827 type:complete len:454 (-) Transcript_96118:110-1471(-)
MCLYVNRSSSSQRANEPDQSARLGPAIKGEREQCPSRVWGNRFVCTITIQGRIRFAASVLLGINIVTVLLVLLSALLILLSLRGSLTADCCTGRRALRLASAFSITFPLGTSFLFTFITLLLLFLLVLVGLFTFAPFFALWVLFHPFFPFCLHLLLRLFVALSAHIVVTALTALVHCSRHTADVTMMTVCQLDLGHAMFLFAFHVLWRLLSPHLFQCKLQRVEAESSYTDDEHGHEDHPHLRILGLFAPAAAFPALHLFSVLFFANNCLERALLCDHLQSLVFTPHPFQAALEEHSTEFLSNSLLPLSCRATRFRRVCQYSVVRTNYRDETLTRALGVVDSHVHLTARKSETKERCHLVRLRAFWRTLATRCRARLLVLLHLIKDILLHTGQVTSAAVYVGLGRCWNGNGDEDQCQEEQPTRLATQGSFGLPCQADHSTQSTIRVNGKSQALS